jgi:FkbM family methyltransferase
MLVSSMTSPPLAPAPLAQLETVPPNQVVTPEGVKSDAKHPCRETYALSRPFIRNWRTAVDVGCRMGEFSRYLQRDFERVYAFDASVHRNFPRNLPLDNVTAFECALGDAAGEIEMHGGGHAFVDGGMRKVPVFRLDDFGLTDVDYIKIDVEGFERRVLLGGMDTILRDRPVIVIEQNDVRLPDEAPFAAKRLLEEHGYRHVATCRRGWDHVMAPQ